MAKVDPLTTGIDSLVQRALTDEAFCSALVRDPAGTLRENGVEPTTEMIEALSGLDAQAVQKLAAAFGTNQAAGA